MSDERLRSLPFLADLDEQDLSRISAGTRQVRLAAGDRLFDEGDAAAAAYVVVDGELEILKKSSAREVLLAVREPGDVVGEMSLLEDAPRMATAKARSNVNLLEIPRAVFDDVLATSTAAARGLFRVLLARWRETESRLRQREQLAQLGTLSAGLAHELNNPAAAANRAAASFDDAARRMAEATVTFEQLSGAEASRAIVDRIVHSESQRLGSLARSDREEAIRTRLDGLGISPAGPMAAVLVDLDGATLDLALDDLDGLDDRGVVSAAVGAAAAQREVASLAAAALEASTRISDIVGAVRSYAFTGQAPTQSVDISRMLDDTLVLMAHKLGSIEVTRDFADVAMFEAYGGELNQVWTNLIDNAADAIASANRTPGRIELRIRTEVNHAVVEVEDNGPGIPDEILPRVFDSFFTTKPPGSGTGLGLDISYGIVVHRHGGEIDIDTEPGRTTVRVRLPMGGGAAGP